MSTPPCAQQELETIHGSIKRIDFANGYGFVIPDGNIETRDIFVHAPVFKRANLYVKTAKGIRVVCECERKPLGLFAKSIKCENTDDKAAFKKLSITEEINQKLESVAAQFDGKEGLILARNAAALVRSMMLPVEAREG